MPANPPFSSILQFFQSFLPGSRQIDGGELQTLASMLFGVKTGIVALAGGGLSAATPALIYGFNSVDTVASSSDSVVLPPAIPGATAIVTNPSATTLAVFGLGSNPSNNNTADVIAPSTSNTTATSQTIATTKTADFYCFKIGVWKMSLTG